MTGIPGWEGSVGPGPGQYNLPHVYARDIHSGAGNCVCGQNLYNSKHVQAAPGVPIPNRTDSYKSTDEDIEYIAELAYRVRERSYAKRGYSPQSWTWLGEQDKEAWCEAVKEIIRLVYP